MNPQASPLRRTNVESVSQDGVPWNYQFTKFSLASRMRHTVVTVSLCGLTFWSLSVVFTGTEGQHQRRSCRHQNHYVSLGIRRAVKKFPEFLWLKKCDNWFNMIGEWPSWRWNKTLASLTDPFMRFCPTIWRWDMLVRSLFRVVSASRWRTEPHIACCAAIPRREKHSCHHPITVISGSRSEWL